MSYIEQNRGKIILIVTGLVLVISVVIYFLQKKVFHEFSDTDLKVYPLVLNVGDSIQFEDSSNINAIKVWQFGDGQSTLDEKGYYVYKNPGFYQITYLCNDEIVKTFSVQVKQTEKKDFGDFFTEIEAPTEAIQFENIIFRAISHNATVFSWDFGETGSVDAKDPLVIYAYQKPGVYEVFLYTDDTAYPISHKIKILPSFENFNEELEVEDVYKVVDDDFKYHLQQIADGMNFNQHYNYLVNKYLCQNENTSVSVNTSKLNSFYYYCMGLRFDKNMVIQSVKVSFDEAIICVKKINVEQSK